MKLTAIDGCPSSGKLSDWISLAGNDTLAWAEKRASSLAGG